MITKRIARNKYKLIAAIIILYLGIDSYLHKGQVRVLVPKTYPVSNHQLRIPIERNFRNENKNWVKAVNSVERMKAEMDNTSSGMECDVYFDIEKNMFDVHHDADNSTGLNFETLLKQYQLSGLNANIWLDFKNLDTSTAKPALSKLIQVRQQYQLQNKILVEAKRADLLTAFHNEGFYTSYYVPLFNPYQIDDDSLQVWVNTIAEQLKGTAINALSGYYFQYPFLANYFPSYDILTWAEKDNFSLTNYLFRRKLNLDKQVFIVLYP